MKRILIVSAVAGMLTSMAATAAVPTNLLGAPASPEDAQRTIPITPTTKYVNVNEGDVVKFVANGTTFTWKFSGGAVTSFQLNHVAPPGAIDHPVMAYVARDVSPP